MHLGLLTKKSIFCWHSSMLHRRHSQASYSYYQWGCQHFQCSWLTTYNKLVYSESEDGGYFKFCLLFGRCGPTQQGNHVCLLISLSLTLKGQWKAWWALLGIFKSTSIPRGKYELKIEHQLITHRHKHVIENYNQLQKPLFLVEGRQLL